VSERLFLQATTHRPRVAMTASAEDAISRSGGWVLDHRLFSNIALALAFEVPADGLTALGDALRTSGWTLAPASAARLAAGSVGESGDLTGFLHLTFVHDEPDVLREVPQVPG
jgi:hypothetical protein